jgi:prohibitin 1
MNIKAKVGAGLLGLGILGTVTLGLMSFTTIEQGHVGVIYNRNGGVEDQTLSQGMHFVSPLKRVTEYPVALETVTFEKLQLATKDGKPLTIDITFNYMNEPDKVVDIFNKFKGAKPEVIEDTFLQSRVKESALAVTSKYTILEIFQNRETIKMEIAKKFTEDVKPHGFIVKDFVLGTPVPDTKTQEAIQRVVDAQQELEALKVETEKAKQEALRKKEIAQGEAEAMLIKAKAEAEANRIVSQSLTPELINKQFIEKWEGKMPQTYVDGDSSGIIINPKK